MNKLWQMIQKLSYTIAGFSIFAVIVLIFINVLCRYFFLYSLPWCDELTRYMFIATTFFTLNIMVAQNAALRADILDNFLSEKGKFILNMFSKVVTVIALAAFTYSGFQFTIVAGATSVSPSLRLPMYYVYMLMPLGYFLALIAVIIKSVEDIKEYRSKEGTT